MKRVGILLAAVLATAAVLSLPGAAVAQGTGRAGLCRQMKRWLIRGGGQASGLYAVDAGTGRPVCGRAARQRRSLASNTKLFTTATALTRFGPRYRIETTLLSDGTLGPDGVLRGSLYLRGGGDPALGVPAFYDRFLGGLGTDLFELRRQLRKAGLRRVTGGLYADDTIFDRLRGVADSGYATSPWIGPLSGLAFDSGYADPHGGGFASDPAKLAAATLARSLRRAGISIGGGVALGVTPPGAETLASVSSPEMSRLVATTDVYSDNFFAETLVKLIGARFGGAGSTRAGTKVVARFARAHGSAVHAVDGSGLTRSNRASPRQVVNLLVAMHRSPLGKAFAGDLALAGREGTVASRMRGSAAAGRCRTKTGTLTGVSNLSGYCFDADGRTMVFSILMNSVRDVYLAHQEQDRIAAAIARY